MKIGIMGEGFVGDALVHGIDYFRNDPNFHSYMDNVSIYDPHKRPESKLGDLINSDLIFICVPTPMGKDGEIDDSIVEECLSGLAEMKYHGVVVIKSTLSPLSVIKFENKFNNIKFLTNPEFLTERYARSDFINSEWILIGSNSGHHEILVEFYEKMFKTSEKMPKIIIVDAEAAMMAKYMTNTWFAVKVSLMNEFYILWKTTINSERSSWDSVVEAFSSDVRVGPTHLDVPGPDGNFGWGGKCFPKDLNTLISLSSKHFCLHNVMKAAWKTNSIIRKNKDWLSIPGAVNQFYKDNMD